MRGNRWPSSLYSEQQSPLEVMRMSLPHSDDQQSYKPDPSDDQAAAEDAAELARLRREAKARTIAAEIQHGKTPNKTTVATQVRILEEQLAQLKDISRLTGQNISGILREIIAEYILRMREDEFVARHLDWEAGGRAAMQKLRAEQEKKLAGEEK